MPHQALSLFLCSCLLYFNCGAATPPELSKILLADNQAITEITGWIYQNLERIRSNKTERDALALRIHDRLNTVRQQYLKFLKEHPENTKARIAYASFLTHLDNRQGAVNEWKQALVDEPNNAAALNNLATHLGSIAIQSNNNEGLNEAFRAMEKTLIIDPKQPLYHHNYATLLCSFPIKASKHYKISSEKIILKAIQEYNLAIQLDPNNFEFAADRAEAFLDLKPFRYEESLIAWRAAQKVATNQDERDWAHLQTAIAHYKASRWSKVSIDINKMSGEHHKPLLNQLRKATAAKIKAENVKP